MAPLPRLASPPRRVAPSQPEVPSRSSVRARRVVLAALLLSAAAGCAGRQKTDALPEWPLPPDPPRVRFVRAFRSEDDLEAGKLQSLKRAFLPASDVAVAQPTGVALSPDERILYVSSNAAGKVLAVDLVSSRMRRFADEDGKAPATPFGVAVDGDGNVYVTDHAVGVVWTYGPDGKFLRRFGEGKLERPTGIAVDRRRKLVYVTAGAASASSHHRVEVFSTAGQHVRTIGTRGHDAGNFNFPANLAVSRDGSLYVVDMLNFRVQIFDGEGKLLGMFGTIGSGQPGTFDKAKAVAFDTFDNVYVSDSAQGMVQIFNPRFQPLMAFGGRGREPGFFSLPTALVIDSKNHIFVADFGAGAVNEYVLINTKAGDALDASPGAPSDASPTPAGQKPQGG